jgi:hypothetical protein
MIPVCPLDRGPRLHRVEPAAAATCCLLLALLATPGAVGPRPARAESAGGSRTDDAVLAIRPVPGTTAVPRNLVLELELTGEPLTGAVDAAGVSHWWTLAGSQTGPRGADGTELEVERDEGGSGTYRLRLGTSRAFLPGEAVRFTLRPGWPLADGRSLPAIDARYRVTSTVGAPSRLAPDGSDEPDPLAPPARDLFEVGQRLAVDTGPNMVVGADLDADDAVDLIVSEVLGDDSIDVFLNGGSGRMEPTTSVAVEGLADPARFAIGDVDGDGLLDVVAIGQESASIAILLGDGTGRLEATELIDLEQETPRHVVIDDLDLDGRADVLLLHLEGDAIRWLRDVGDPPAARGVDGDAPAVTAADRGEPGAAVARHAVRSIPALPAMQGLVVADVDGDLLPDLVVTSARADAIGVLPAPGVGWGTGRPDTYVIPVGRRPRSLAAADLDGDGHVDLAVTAEGSNELSTLRGHGDGTFEAPVARDVGDRPALPAIADLDGDGHLDLAVPNLFSDDVTLLMGTGDGQLLPGGSLPVGAGPTAATAADFDGDGDVDLGIAHSIDDDVTLYANRHGERARGTFTRESRSLRQNVPNPFNPATTIHYTLADPGPVNLVVFNTSGKLVATLVDGERPAGQHVAHWDGTDDAGDKAPSGIYFYRLTTDETVELRRMTLIR